ncbi:S66 peptidase family protein [Mycobacterium sp. LTG2003]
MSPASPPDRDSVSQTGRMLRSWGLDVDFGDHVYRRYGYLAGTDDERLADLNAALRDPTVRAIVATRGGKGSYRIADRLDFDAARRDPKFLVGISDITILHMSLWRHSAVAGLHGALYVDESTGRISEISSESLRAALMADGPSVVTAVPDDPTHELTTVGTARGPLLGGNLEMIATAAGWALPDLHGAILFIEAIDMYIGQVDRRLTMLRNAGHLDGVCGIAVGRFTKIEPSKGISIVALLRDHFARLDVPILGGLPLGHGAHALTVPLGAQAVIDTGTRTLTVD